MPPPNDVDPGSAPTLGSLCPGSVLARMRAKYGFTGGKYEPKPDCKFCKGAGERKVKTARGETFCICLYVDPVMSDFAGESLGATARKLREELESKGER